MMLVGTAGTGKTSIIKEYLRRCGVGGPADAVVCVEEFGSGGSLSSITCSCSRLLSQ